MKHYSILIVNYKDETPDKVGIHTFDTADAAIADFYEIMSQYVNVAGVKSVNVEAKSAVGLVHKHDTWEAPVVVEEPADEVVTGQ